MGQIGLFNSVSVNVAVKISKYMRESFNDGNDGNDGDD